MRLHAREGTWFAVPTLSEGYALGLLARASRSGIHLGYFFGPRLATVPTSKAVSAGGFGIHDVVTIEIFGAPELNDGRWPTIGRDPSWDEHAWPLPAFGVVEPLRGIAFRRVYPNDDPSERPRQTVVSPVEQERLPRDRLCDALALRRVLERKLLSLI